MMKLQTGTCVAYLIAISLLFDHSVSASAAQTDPRAAAMAPYVNDDTFAVAYFDIAKLPKVKAQNDETPILGVLPLMSDDAQVILLVLHGLDTVARAVGAAGVDTMYAVAGLGDMHEKGGPLLVFQVKQGASANDVAKTLKSATGMLGPFASKLDVRVHGERAVLVGSVTTVDRYMAYAPGNRVDLVDPLVKLSGEGSVAAAVFCPGPDFRRVVRELWPDLPGPFAALRGELADKWRHLEFAIDTPPEGRPRIALVASDPDSAALFASMWSGLPKSLAGFRESDGFPPKVKEYIEALVGAMPAKLEGSRVDLRFQADDAQMEKLRALAGDAAHASMESAQRDQRFQQFKNLSLAMINHESATKLLPAAAIRDKEGRPLLSWRVKILPFLGDSEADLYKQFRLDEPWDSEHNRKLLDRMPSVFADPDPDIRKQIGSNKTTYLVPAGPRTAFFNDEGATMRDISDGLDRTIFIVEVVPSLAVEWTKPEDWQVDVENPVEGVKRDDRRVFVAAFGDGHIEAIPVNVDFKKLRGLLTRNGGELFDWP